MAVMVEKKWITRQKDWWIAPLVRERAYAAAMLDGEGSVAIKEWRSGRAESSHYYGLMVKISNKSYSCLQTMQSAFVLGKVSPSHDGMYEWQLYSKNAQRFLVIVLPYLLIKKEQALLGIEFQKRLDAYRRKTGYHRKGDYHYGKDLIEQEYRRQCYLQMRTLKGEIK